MAKSTPDFAAEGLLKGLRGGARAARQDLLEELHEAGVSLDELKQAVAEDRLALLPVERVIGEEGRYTIDDVAEQSGLDAERVGRVRQALGLPRGESGERIYNDDDVDAAIRARRFVEAGLPEEGTLEVTRVIGQSMARVAEAVRSVVADALVRPGDTERDLGLRYADMARTTAPLLGPVFQYVFTEHLREQLHTDVVSRAEVRSGRVLPGAREVTVCFADLVGFTRLGTEVAADELGSVAGRLAGMAGDVAEPPVRLIKTIGDAAMLVSTETPPLLEASLELVAAANAEGEDFPLLRVGVAAGSALSRGGDWYGHPINVASRVTDIARPDSVLATEEVHDAAADDFRWSFAGERRLKGVGEPVRLFRARRHPAEDESEP